MGTTAVPLYSRFRLSSPICTLHSRTGTAEPHMNSHELHGSNTLITCVTAVCNGQTRLETLKRLYLGHCTLQTKHTFLDLWTWWCNTENSQLDGLGQSAPIHLTYTSAICQYVCTSLAACSVTFTTKHPARSAAYMLTATIPHSRLYYLSTIMTQSH